MPINQEQISNTNIVVVYRGLDVPSIPRDAARKLYEGGSPQLDDGNDALAVRYPEQRIECIFQDQRVQVKDHKDTPPSESSVPHMIKKAQEFIEYSHVEAYGLNYDVFFPSTETESVAYLLQKRFLKENEDWDDTLEGKIRSFGLNFKVDYQGADYNIQLIPASASVPDGDETKDIAGLFAKVNIHHADHEVPEESQLKEQLQKGFDHTTGLVRKVLNHHE